MPGVPVLCIVIRTQHGLFWKPDGQTAVLVLEVYPGFSTEWKTTHPLFPWQSSFKMKQSLSSGRTLGSAQIGTHAGFHKLQLGKNDFVPENFKEGLWIIQQIDSIYILSTYKMHCAHCLGSSGFARRYTHGHENTDYNVRKYRVLWEQRKRNLMLY